MSQITFPTNTTTLLVNTLNANKIVYLPAISTVNAGTVYYIKDICGNATASSIYVYAAGSDTIEKQNTNAAAAIINTNFGSIMFTPDGINNWMVLQHYATNAITKVWKTTPALVQGIAISYTPPNTYLLLTWNPTANTVTYSIAVYSNPSQTTVGSTPFQSFSYTNTFSAITTNALTQNYYYYFTVTATNPLGYTTTTSSLVQATLYPNPPTNALIGFVYPTVTVTWTASPLASSYTVVLYRSPTSAAAAGTTFQFFSGVVGTSQTNTITLVNGYFYATVTAANTYGYSTAATSSTVLVTLPPPGTTNTTITFSFPNAATPPTFTCTWVADSQAATYTIEFFESVSPGTSSGASFQKFTLNSTTSQVSSKIPVNTDYYYATVTSVNPFGFSAPVTTTNYVQALTQAAATPYVSIVFSFPNAVTPPTFTATWSSTTLTASYTIVFYSNQSPATSGGISFQPFTGVTGTSQTSSTLPTNNYFYYATVTSVNLYVNSSPVTTNSYVQAIIIPLGTTFVFITFSFTSSAVTPTFTCTWNSVSIAATYTIVFYGSASAQASGGSALQTFTEVTGTSQISSTIPTNNYYYYATVVAVNKYGSSPAITSSSYVQAITYPPGSLSVSISFSFPNAAFTPTFTATWSSVPTAASFTIVFYGSASAQTSSGSVLQTFTGNTGTTQVSSSIPTNNYYYYATVTSVNTYGSSSAITSSSYVQATIIPIISSATMSFLGNQVTASWIASPYTATFTVVFYQVATQTTTGGSVLETDTDVTSTSQTTTTALTSGQYYYAIITAINTYGTSASFTTSNAIQATILPTGGAVTLNSFTGTGSTVTGGLVTITTPASLATGYTIYISTTTNPTGFNFTTTTTGSNVSFSGASLSYNTTYYAIMVAYNTYGNTSTPIVSAGNSISALYTYSGTLVFTSAGSTGGSGPILSQCRTAYSSFGSWVSNTAYFNMTTQGVQKWTIPVTRNYTIVCSGIAGVIITAIFSLTQNQVLNIVVGQPAISNQQAGAPTSGNGGTFVFDTNGVCLVATGGTLSTSGTDGTTVGASSITYPPGNGGINGGNGTYGSGASFASGDSYMGGGGGLGAVSYPNFNGGMNASGQIYYYGGYGGGGVSGNHYYNGALGSSVDPFGGAGGGGGYSGGGGGAVHGAGGVGGSYCSVTPISSVASGGNGSVSIT